MAYWLLKTEPGDYGWADLLHDGKTVWDGVANNAALKHMRTMSKGDLTFIYHTAEERRVMGVAEIIKSPYADPKLNDPRRVVIDVRAKNTLPEPVTLAQTKADPAFEGWDLLRQPRLSVMPVPPKLWIRILKLGL